MFLLGLLLPVCFITGITGASIPTQWPLLSLVAAAAVWRKGALTLPHYLGLGFVLWAALGTFWSQSVLTAIYGLWFVAIWAGSFWLGYTIASPRELYRGLAVGLAVSSALAIFQWFGYHPVPTFSSNNVAGLLYNRTVLGSTAALLILLLAQERLWLYIPPLLPGLILSGSRGGLLILAIGFAYRYLHWTISLVLTCAASMYFTIHLDSSNVLRIEFWSVAYNALTLAGWGAGSFSDVLVLIDNKTLIYPEFVHNDYLQLGFEFGLMALAPVAIFALAFAWRPSPFLAAFAVLAGFYFPLHSPLSAFLGCLVAGHSLRGFSLDGLIIQRCRPDLLPWASYQESGAGPIWGKDVPIQS